MYNMLRLRRKTDSLISKKVNIIYLQTWRYSHCLTVTIANFHIQKYIPCLFFLYLITIIFRCNIRPFKEGALLYMSVIYIYKLNKTFHESR